MDKPKRLLGASLIATGITLGISMFLQMIGTTYVALSLLTARISTDGVSVVVTITQIVAEIIFCTFAVLLVHYGWRLWRGA